MPGDSRFIRACRREPVDATPVWIMRQAGRYLPEYRELRRSHSLLSLCRDPDLACEVAMQPLRRFDLDAAILFSDLLIPVAALGVDFDIVENRGPVVARPLRDRAGIGALKAPPDVDAVGYVFETILRMKEALASMGRAIPVIGFAGAPFTLGSYLIEGGPSRDFRQTKLLMHSDPEAWGDLMRRLAELVIACAERQVAAGAEAIQIFDSWAGSLSRAEYRRFVLEPTRGIFRRIAGLGVPSIHFGTQIESILDLMAEAGGDVLSVDWRIPLSTIRARWPDRGIQGNLDPLALFLPAQVQDALVDEVLQDAGQAPGHVFNLGHGILKETPVESVTRLVQRVHQETRRARQDL